VNSVVFSGVTAKSVSPSVLNGDVERIAGGVLRAEDLNWVVEVVYVGVLLDEVCCVNGALVHREHHGWSLSIFPAC